MTGGADVSAVVLASRGGARLARTLASVAWTGERIVWDPAARLDAAAVPPDARVERGQPAPARDWVLVLAEDEAVPAGLADAIAVAVADPAAPAGFRVPVEVRALGTALRLRGARVRLARREGARLRLGAGLAPCVAPPAGPVGRLRPALVAEGAPSLAQMVEDLDGDGTALAAVLDGSRATFRARRLLSAPVAAFAAVLAARATGEGGWGRWILAVLAGYRALLAWAKLWERRRLRGVE